MGIIFYYIGLLLILILWYAPIYNFIQLMKLNSYEELDEIWKDLKDHAEQNKIMRIILIIFRAPLIIILLIPMYIKISKLVDRKYKDQ